MSTPETPGESPASGSPAKGTSGNSGRAKGPNPTVGEVAGRSTDAARAEQARTMRDRVSQQEAAAEAVTKAHPTVQRPPAQRPGRPVVTGTAAPRGQLDPPLASQPPGRPAAPASPAPASPAPASPAAAGLGPGATAAETADAVDAPTSHISRSKVPTTGMQDLSAVQHPSTASAEAARDHSEGGRPRPAVSVGSRRGRGPLRASMQLRSIDPWSTLKISLLLSVALFFVWLVAVGIIYLVLDGMGVWDRLNTGVTDIMASSDSAPTLIGPGQVFGVAAIIGIINVVLFTAMATIGAFIYNMSADAVGGVEVTLADRD